MRLRITIGKKKDTTNQLFRASEAKKQVFVLAIFGSMTGIKEAFVLGRISCIYYLVQFKKDTDELLALINLGSEINIISPANAKKLGF